MNTLTEEQLLDIIKNKKISECSSAEKEQVMEFAFGAEYMASNDKGKRKQYIEKSNICSIINASMTREDKIKFIIRQERLAGNLWKWIEEADDETVNDLYDYWTQEIV